MKKKLFNLPFIFILTTALFSCSNILDASLSKQASDYSITGYVSPYDFAETAPSKSAFPTVPSNTDTLYYTVTATHGSASVSENVQGTNGAQFNLKLPSSGDWSVTATCFGTDSSRATVVYKTVKPAVISISNASPSKFANLTLKPLMTFGKTGTLNLEIDGSSLDPSFFPSTIKVECISGNLPDMDDRISYSPNLPTKKYTLKTITGKVLPSGSYTFNINFIKTTDSSAIYFYSVTETVNIYDGLETNRWVKNGNEEYITSDGKFKLTDSIVNKFQQESIYVDFEALSDNASGTWLDPYKNLDAAIARLTASSSVKTIFVSGNHTTSKNLNFSNGGNCNHDLTIKKNPRATSKPVITTTTSSSFIVGGPHKIVIENIDFNGCGNEVEASPTGTSGNNSGPTEKSGAFLYFPSSTGSAELTNCTISDYYSHKGGAICAGANSTFTLTNVDITRCKATDGGAIAVYGNFTYESGNITDCSATEFGGAIYHKGGNLTIEEGVCIGKRNATTIADLSNPSEHKYSNYAANAGGGIYSEKGNLSLEGLISYNAANATGGGLYVKSIGNDLTYNSSENLDVCYNYARISGGGICYDGLTKGNFIYNIREEIHHNQADNGGGLYIGNLSNSSTFYITSQLYNNKAISNTNEYVTNGSGGGLFINSNGIADFYIYSEITYNSASNFGGGIYLYDIGAGSTNFYIHGKLASNEITGSNTIRSSGIAVNQGQTFFNSQTVIDPDQDMYVCSSDDSLITIQETLSGIENITLYLNTNPDPDPNNNYIKGFKSAYAILTGATEELIDSQISKFIPADPTNYGFIKNPSSPNTICLSKKVYIAGSDSIKLPHGVNQALSTNPDRGKKTAPFASLSYASRQFIDSDFITYYIEGTTVEGSTTEAENPCIFMDNIAKTITVRGYEGGKRATLKGISENAGFGIQYSTYFTNINGNLTISDIDIDGTGSKYSSAVITGYDSSTNNATTYLNNVNIKNFTFAASGTDPETGVILCDSPDAVINIKGGSIKDCNRTGGAILARQGNVHISQHEISGCTNTKTGEDAVVTSGNDTNHGYLHLENTKISGTDSTKAVVKVYGFPSNADAINVNVGGDTTIEDGYVYLVNNANITLTSNITSDICAHIKSSNPNTYPTVLRVDTNFSRTEQEALINNNYQKFIYDGTYELKPVITSSVYTYLYAVSYVDGSNGKTGVDGGNGAKDNPFKTVSEAVDELRTQLNSGTHKNAIVYVAGTTEESSVINTEDASVSLSTITIKQWPGKTDAVIKRGATHTDSIIKVSTNSSLTLEDIEINGNNAVLSNINGAGLSIQGASATATLTNVKIYGCKVRQDTTPPNVNTNYGQGGAIFAKGNLASLYLKGNTVIGSDITGALSEENSSNCAKEGGAIYFQTTSSRALEIEDTVVIKGNYAVSNGGAIYMRQQYLSANIGGSIRNNAAGIAGGAIYNYGCTSVINGTISGNTSPSGSIYAAFSAQIKLNTNSNIGPDDEVVLFRDPSSSYYGQIYIGGALNAQSNPIKVSCENPDTSTAYVTGPNALAIRNGIPKLTYNGAFSFITSGDNLGKIEHAPLYVAGSGSGMTGSDSNPGTETQPLATVAKAVDLIKNYGGTIYVAGTTNEDSSISFAESTNIFEIKKWPDKTAAVIKRANTLTNGCLINIQTGNKVTFKDLDIDGSNVSATSGSAPAGINNYAGSTGSLTLENVNILNMIRSAVTNPLGGAIYTSDTPFTMKGGSITNCVVGTTTTPAGLGGAIYKVGTDVPCVLENVTFFGNKAEKGNGIYVASGPITLKGSTNLSTSTGDINDIYLADNGSIKIDGTLSSATVAQITVPVNGSNEITRTDAVLVPNRAGSDEVEKSYKKFIVKPTNYELVQDGMLAPVIYPTLSNLKTLIDAQFENFDTVIVEIENQVNLTGEVSVPDENTLYVRAKPGSTEPTITNTSSSERMFYVIGDGKLVVTDVTLDGNNVPVTGAGSIIYVSGTLTLNGDTKITNGLCVPTESFTGGAIYSTPAGSIYITDNVIISNNKTNDEYHMGTDIELYGGGICAKGPLYISGNAKITENSVRNDVQYEKIYGAGIYSSNSLTITDNVEISDNYLEIRALGMFANGAGIYATGSLSINGTDVKINNNHVNVYGELTDTQSNGIGIYAPTATVVSLEGNITVTGNSTQTDWEYDSGYGIYAADLPRPADIHFEEGSEGLRVYGNTKNGEAPQNMQYFTNRR